MAWRGPASNKPNPDYAAYRMHFLEPATIVAAAPRAYCKPEARTTPRRRALVMGALTWDFHPIQTAAAAMANVCALAYGYSSAADMTGVALSSAVCVQYSQSSQPQVRVLKKYAAARNAVAASTC